MTCKAKVTKDWLTTDQDEYEELTTKFWIYVFSCGYRLEVLSDDLIYCPHCGRIIEREDVE